MFTVTVVSSSERRESFFTFLLFVDEGTLSRRGGFESKLHQGMYIRNVQNVTDLHRQMLHLCLYLCVCNTLPVPLHLCSRICRALGVAQVPTHTKGPLVVVAAILPSFVSLSLTFVLVFVVALPRRIPPPSE